MHVNEEFCIFKHLLRAKWIHLKISDQFYSLPSVSFLCSFVFWFAWAGFTAFQRIHERRFHLKWPASNCFTVVLMNKRHIAYDKCTSQIVYSNGHGSWFAFAMSQLVCLLTLRNYFRRKPKTPWLSKISPLNLFDIPYGVEIWHKISLF